jgi:hypothetical protein
MSPTRQAVPAHRKLVAAVMMRSALPDLGFVVSPSIGRSEPLPEEPVALGLAEQTPVTRRIEHMQWQGTRIVNACASGRPAAPRRETAEVGVHITVAPH